MTSYNLNTKIGTIGTAKLIPSSDRKKLILNISGFKWEIINEAVDEAIITLTSRANKIIVGKQHLITLNFIDTDVRIMASVINNPGGFGREVTLSPDGIKQLLSVLDNVKNFPNI